MNMNPKMKQNMRPNDPHCIGLILDGGHGTRKYTKGKHSPDRSLYEGEWAREIVSRLSVDLKAIGFDVRILVPEDNDIRLSERVRRANKIMSENPDKKWYYISIHCNAAGSQGMWMDARGWCVYVSNGASAESRELAQTMYQVANEYGLRGNRSVPKERYWQANFTVITDTWMPAILTENMFQDNRQDCEFLKSEKGKQTILNLHTIGICRFFGIPHSVRN